VKYLLLMAEPEHFQKWQDAGEEHRNRVYADFAAFDAAVAERGTIRGGEALAAPDTARTVGPGPQRPVTDGPYAETVEQLGGFYLIDVPGIEDAVELAALLPREYLVEVREVVEVTLG
jgi:hypothetical protein